MAPVHKAPLLVNLTALAIGTGGAWYAAVTGGSTAGLVAAWFSGFGVMIAFTTWFHAWLQEREAAERRDFEELQRSQVDGALFASKPESLSAARTRDQFERYWVPIFTLLMALLQGGASYWFWTRMVGGAVPVAEKTTLVLSLFGLLALGFFALGKYSAGLARHNQQYLLRPAANHLLLGAMLFALVTFGTALSHFGFPRLDKHLAHAFGGLLGIVAVETVIHLILEFYRPRVRGARAHPPYESRLLGLLGHPEGLVRTAAQTLDYQFGFKVSETWFYRYLEQALSGLVLLQLAAVWLSTGVVVIEPHEEALLERFGRPVAGRSVLGSGLHFKWPWPIERAYLISSQEIRTFNVGFLPDPALEGQDTLLWTRAHYREEFNLLVASAEGADVVTAGGNGAAVPVNLITVSIPIQYRITNLLQWAVGHADGEKVLPMLATSEVTHYLVSVDFEEFMSKGRQKAAAALRERIQERATAERLGIEVLFVGLQDVHPPVQIAGAYEAVIAATQDRQTRILNAEAYQAERLPRAIAEASVRVLEQRARGVSRVFKASAEASRFTNQMLAAAAAPGVYHTWAYHDSLTRALLLPRKFILATTNNQEQFWLNFEEKLRTDLLDVAVPPPTRSGASK